MQVELDFKAKVYAFPPARRVDRVAVVASMLEGMKAAEASRYWKRTVQAMAKQMKRVGVDQAEIETALRGFFDAVQAELVRRSYRQQGGAA